ncbi:hypothetical protein [Natrialba sp. SSL1]|uniref:hypothetical protein n=1 Tax=Natrialba sp. SSL1 TaxID=1869245 RepID=UPI001495F5A0|nr:hypothetical protein [Natrialba sp. SSL1]
MTEHDDTVTVLKWFVAPAVLVFALVNLFQISPLLASWTTITLLGAEGNALYWLVLILVDSVLLAVLGGFCSYSLVT